MKGKKKKDLLLSKPTLKKWLMGILKLERKQEQGKTWDIKKGRKELEFLKSKKKKILLMSLLNYI